MQTVSEMANFVELWDHVQSIQLSDHRDQISWIWTTNGEYNAKSAYLAQFNGTYSTFTGEHIWKAEAEGKHKFFAWLLVQSKLLMADNLILRSWPCNPVCALCDQEPETASHLILHCSFARQVWDRLARWTGDLISLPDQGLQVMEWWESELAHLPRKIRRQKAAIMIYAAWNIWKARNHRVFDNKDATPADVMQELKLEMNWRRLACGGDELPYNNV